MQRKIGIVVVSYHNFDMTTRYVSKELPKLTIPYTLVVVNVAATREESSQLAEACGLCFVDNDGTHKFPDSQGYLIWDDDNLGYAKGNNKGVRFLNSIGTFSHYLFSNDDIEIIDTNILDVLISSMKEHPDVACIGPRIIGVDGHDQSPHDRYISPYRLIGWRLFPFMRKKKNPSPQGDKKTPLARYTYWVCGAFLLVDAKAFNVVGMFDENIFLYYEEVILSERLSLIEKKIYYEPDVAVLHYEGGSSSMVSEKKRETEKMSREYYFKEYKHVNYITMALHHFFAK